MSMHKLIKKIAVLTESRAETPALAEAKSLIRHLEEAVVLEKNMTPAQKEKREEIVMSMKKDTAGLKERYGKRWKDVMYATATKQAMTEAAKPDFLDIDKDGDKSEPMKKAAQDTKKPDESADSDKAVSESLNVNISATDSDALPVIMKLAGMQTMMIAPDAEYAAEPDTTSQGACMEAREDEIPFDNKPREKYSSISESLNVNISATDSDALPVIMKLAGMQTMIIAPDAEYAAEPDTTSQGACMEAREDEIPFDNKPREKYSSIRDITKTGNDLNRPKTQHADKAKLGDNPLATELSESLWESYQAIKKQGIAEASEYMGQSSSPTQEIRDAHEYMRNLVRKIAREKFNTSIKPSMATPSKRFAFLVGKEPAGSPESMKLAQAMKRELGNLGLESNLTNAGYLSVAVPANFEGIAEASTINDKKQSNDVMVWKQTRLSYDEAVEK